MRHLAHHSQKIAEELAGVVGTRGSLGVVLHAAGGDVERAQALNGAVVEVDVGDLGGPGERRGVDREAVVLRGDVDLARSQLLDRLVGAAVAELELVGLAAQGSARIWWPRQMPKTGFLPSNAATVSRMPGTASGSPGPLVRKMPSGSSASTVAGRRPGGHHRDPAALIDQQAEHHRA